MADASPVLAPHRLRELALQVLFAWDAQNAASEELAMEMTLAVEPQASRVRQVVDLAKAAWENRKTADQWTTRLAPQWPTHRQPGVDRSILRLAIYEMTHSETPPKVAIDEAIELAKEFSTANSPSFVNGVLDAVLKEVAALKSEASSS